MTQTSMSLLTITLLLNTTSFADTTLEDIQIVSINKTLQSIKETTANVSVITAEEIEEKGYQTVAQALSQQSGMVVVSNGGLGQLTSLFTRGMNAGQTLVLLDGMRLNDPTSPNGAAHLEMLTTENIEQIEILKGGQSSIWGSNASAGIINIITKTPKDGVHGSATLGYGSYNTKEVSTNISYKGEKLTVQATAAYLETDGFSALSPRSAEADGSENKNYSLKFAYNFNENNAIDLLLNQIKTDVQYDTYATPDDDKSYLTSEQTNYAFNYRYNLNDYSATLHASRGEYLREDYRYGAIIPTIYNAEITEYSFINAYDYSNGKVILGLEYSDFENKESIEPTSSYENKAIFISNIYHINESTLLETNLRHDNYNAFEDKTTYKIGLKHNHTFLEGFTTSANYYTSYDAPTIYQISPSTYVVPNPNLTPSYTKGFDITASYKKLISVTYFNNKVEDYIDYETVIDYETDPVTYLSGYVNVVDGTSKFEGLEIEGFYVLPLNIHLSANYTHLLKYEREDGSEFIRRPKDMLNASLNYYADNEINFGVNAQYIGDRIDNDFSTVPASNVSTGNYTLWNLNFGANIAKNLDLIVNARNIFDKEYQSVYAYATEGASLYAKVKYSF